MKTTKLNMKLISSSVSKENLELLNQGHALPVLENGTVKMADKTSSHQSLKRKEVA
jgi:hypothetical protein